MKFNVRGICGKYTEMSVDEIETGTLDNDEAASLAGDKPGTLPAFQAARGPIGAVPIRTARSPGQCCLAGLDHAPV